MSPRWLFFPAPAPDQYIYTFNSDRSSVRGSPSPTARKQTAVGTESGTLVDQFAPFATNTQIQLLIPNTIQFKVQSNDTSTPGFENVTNIQNNITACTLTVGSNVFTPESITVAGTNTRPIFKMVVTDGSANTFYSDNNLDDTDNIDIVMTLTF